MNTYGKSTGKSGSYSTNYQLSGRELYTPDEVRMLDNKYAILFIRGERPIKDLKYDIMKHPNVKYSADGKAKPYKHGEVTNSIATINIDLSNVKRIDTKDNEQNNSILDEYDFISSEEMERYLRKGGNK